MSEDIEAKIRRLRELGRASAESETPQPIKTPVKKPPRRPRRIGSIREKERKKRILIGASIIITVILIISIGAYVYLQSSAANELTKAKKEKLAEVNAYFKPGSELMNTSFGKNARDELIKEINSAQSVDQVKSINVKAAYQKAWSQYQAYLQEQKRLEMERQLNQTKKEKIDQIEAQFSPLLAMPLPDDLKKKVVDSMKNLEEQIMNATSEDRVKSINADPYLLELWREYYYYLIDSIPTKNVILEKDNVKRIVSKADAKALLGGILDYRELTQYHVYKVEYVDIALVLPRSRINGAFLTPGDEVVLFAKNATDAPFREIVNGGYVELVLLPTQAGSISVSEAQSQTSSSSTTSSNQYSEQHNTQYTPGGNSITNGQAISDTYGNSQTSSQSASASYSYNVNLAEILKAIAAGKIQASEDVKEQLREYGWKIIDLEKESGMLVLDPNAQFLVILKVPSMFVPEVLSNQQYLYIAKVAG